jgi:hypothetical protein
MGVGDSLLQCQEVVVCGKVSMAGAKKAKEIK